MVDGNLHKLNEEIIKGEPTQQRGLHCRGHARTDPHQRGDLRQH